MEITDPSSAPTFSFPFVLDCHEFRELMVAQGEGRSPMTSSGAKTDSKPIIIIILLLLFTTAVTIAAMQDTLKHKIVASAVKSSFGIYCNRNAAVLDAP